MATLSTDRNILRQTLEARFRQSIELPQAVIGRQCGDISRACLEMARRFYRGGRILAIGQGAAASDARHVAVEFVHPVIVGKRALPALALSGSSDVVCKKISLLAGPSDMLLAFSDPGNEQDLLPALRKSHDLGLLNIAFSSGNGREILTTAADYSFEVPSNDPAVAQETHETIYHILWELVHLFFEHQALLAETPANDQAQPPSKAAKDDPLRSNYDRLFYPFLYHDEALDADKVLQSVEQSIQKKCNEIISLRQNTLEKIGEQLIEAALTLAEAFSAGATLLAFGNGGSATDVMDIVSDLSQPPLPHWSPLPAIDLTEDIPIISAVGNDVGFDKIFSRQIIALGRPGDIALGITTSGNSANIIAALEQAKKQQMLTIALCGYDGAKIARSSAVDICLVSECDYVPRIQEVQATLCHSLLELIHKILPQQKSRNLPASRKRPERSSI